MVLSTRSYDRRSQLISNSQYQQSDIHNFHCVPVFKLTEVEFKWEQVVLNQPLISLTGWLAEPSPPPTQTAELLNHTQPAAALQHGGHLTLLKLRFNPCAPNFFYET